MIAAIKVDWAKFQSLPGAAETNFETLGRVLVRLNYGRFGVFRATAQMPGIEFHLRLNERCALGKKGDWFGWQCRWYQTTAGQSLGANRRAKVLKALRTTERTIPGLTHWILWTRHPLTKADEKWFHHLKTKLQLRAWSVIEAEELLSGDALVLRETYFGEWVLRPESLADRHQHAVSSIHTRWLPDAHQEVDAERKIRRILGEADSWMQLVEVAADLEKAVKGLKHSRKLPAHIVKPVGSFVRELEAMATTLRAAPTLLAKGDFDQLYQTFEQRPKSLSLPEAAVPRVMRSLKITTNFEASNGLAYHQRGVRLLEEMQRCLGIRLHAVMADAGGGKTQLAAELTAARDGRPAGVLLHGRELRAGQNLDDLSRRFVLSGNPLPTFEALVAALDAAGQRSRCRLPLVIDGLNEAEDPRDWKRPLCEAEVMLKKYPSVLLVVTLRTGAWRPEDDERYFFSQQKEAEHRTVFAKLALPEGTSTDEMKGFGDDTDDAIARYFRHYRINAQEADAPRELIAHPLTLRIFCEVTNPPPQTREVGPEAMPRSLVKLFERYIDKAAERIGDLSPRIAPFGGQEVRCALNILGENLWDSNQRELDQQLYRSQINDNGREWEHSILKYMEQEGLVLRVEGATEGMYGVVPVYDAMGGYIIANSLLAGMGRDQFKEWISNVETVARFRDSDWIKRHPLADDIFTGLAALVPRRYQREQLWQLVPVALQPAALLKAIDLEGDLIDTGTVKAIGAIVRDSAASPGIFTKLSITRAIPKHPLNAIFLDGELRKMTNAERDLRWTEHVRQDYLRVHKLPRIGAGWEYSVEKRTESDRLRARWLMWLLTSTAHELRAKVTRALYWFGRGDPQPLFDLTIESLTISDPYVPERMLAASYGVAMARHGSMRDPQYETSTLKEFGRALYEKMFTPKALFSTTHILMREYAKRIVELALLTSPRLLSVQEKKRVQSPFPKDLHGKWGSVSSERDDEDQHPSPFRMDFENYTLGRLVPDRRNYDYENRDYRKVRAQVLWRVHELGWAAEKFHQIDSHMDSHLYSPTRMSDSSQRMDRYGKKYSWIAYYELAGVRHDLGLLNVSYWDQSERTSKVDIDPSFPVPRQNEKLFSDNWLSGAQKTLPKWISKGPIPDTTPLLRRKVVLGQKGPWIALDGFITQQDKTKGRDIFCFIRAFLAPRKDAKALAQALKKQSMRGRWLPEKPREIYAFAGEFPWCSSFGVYPHSTLRFVTERRVRKVMRPRGVNFDGESSQRMREVLALLRAGKPFPKSFIRSSVGASLERVPVMEVHEKAVEYKVLIPVCDFQWEGPTIDDEPSSGVFLAKHLAKDLDLRWIPSTYDVADAEGRRATCQTNYGEHSRDDRQTMFFFREDLLLDYLQRKKQVLIWVSWGEREISHNLIKDFEKHREEFTEPFKVFHTVKVFRPTVC